VPFFFTQVTGLNRRSPGWGQGRRRAATAWPASRRSRGAKPIRSQPEPVPQPGKGNTRPPPTFPPRGRCATLGYDGERLRRADALPDGDPRQSLGSRPIRRCTNGPMGVLTMRKSFDPTMRDLYELAPAAWLEFFGIPVPDPSQVQVIDSNLSTITA